jgi:hypothetical protein
MTECVPQGGNHSHLFSACGFWFWLSKKRSWVAGRCPVAKAMLKGIRLVDTLVTMVIQE